VKIELKGHAEKRKGGRNKTPKGLLGLKTSLEVKDPKGSAKGREIRRIGRLNL
jgi:hypothetical protein